MLNFSLTTVFILQVIATSKGSCSLVFCGKAVLRLALIHSKYIGHGKIAKIRTQQRIKFPLLTFPATTQQKRRSFESDFIKSKLLRKFSDNSQGKARRLSFSFQLYKRVFLQALLPVSFPNIFQNTYFYMQFQKITFLISVGGNFHHVENQLTIPYFGVSTAILNPPEIFCRWYKLTLGLLRGRAKHTISLPFH